MKAMRIIPNFDRHLQDAIQKRHLRVLSGLVDHARSCGLNYKDVQARSGLDLPTFESLMEELDDIDSEE